jgi:hypothetical protein
MTMKSLAVLVIFGLATSLQPPRVDAQGVRGQGNQGADRNPLARVKTLKCTFQATAAGLWKNDQGEAQLKTEEVPATIENIDAQEGTAHIPGQPGDIAAVLTANSLHFMDRSFLGSLTVITVFTRESPKGKYRAVRSRHDYLPINIPGMVTEPTVMQSYGFCEIVE